MRGIEELKEALNIWRNAKMLSLGEKAFGVQFIPHISSKTHEQRYHQATETLKPMLSQLCSLANV